MRGIILPTPADFAGANKADNNIALLLLESAMRIEVDADRGNARMHIEGIRFSEMQMNHCQRKLLEAGWGKPSFNISPPDGTPCTTINLLPEEQS